VLRADRRADRSDPNWLDENGDGIACPELPGPRDEAPVDRIIMTDICGAPVVQRVPAVPEEIATSC
jgi:hypothetical protein